MGKRKRSSATEAAANADSPMPPPPPPTSNSKARRSSQRKPSVPLTQPTTNGDVLDAPNALRASPDSDVDEKITPGNVKAEDDSDSPLSDVPEEKIETPAKKRRANGKASASATQKKEEPETPGKAHAKSSPGNNETAGDPEAEGDEEEVDPEEVKEASRRPPPVNSDYLPLPWKGRIGYACLCTYLRFANPPVFCSRTTRIASILEHRHPLADPSQPEHPTKNRPDKEKPADPALGQSFVENLCLQNVRDMAKLIRWNDKYNIKFLRLSSEAFPFASHAEYGYRLAPFAAGELAKVGKVAAELGHRLTTHPGQFTQLGSPKQNVIDASIRDLEYHDEMLSLLKLPPQQDRDAVMILHMGGVFGDKAATLDRFRENYQKLNDSIKNRLVLENDDMSWSVHDLLPVCQELNIPFVLDFHHHNIIFDPEKIREGSKDIVDLYPQILETWRRKGITPKMHYSEPTPAAITGKQRRKHNPRVASLPPCPPDMDLMIEAKDKEQAVFELMRTFKLPGYERLGDIIPHVREDENKPVKPPPKKKATPKKKRKAENEDADDGASVADAPADPEPAPVIPEEELNMGGPDGRVYWPPGMEEWLRPVKRVVKKKDPDDPPATKLSAAQRKIVIAQAKAELAQELTAKKNKVSSEAIEGETAVQKQPQAVAKAAASMNNETKAQAKTGKKAAATKGSKTKGKRKKQDSPDSAEEALEEAEAEKPTADQGKRQKSARASRGSKKSYKEEEEEQEVE
ncbi:MAG: hypothetical protein Q9162_004249 [Coniocarpon cinnabarinum]